jgi:hypothetical protein
MEHFPVDVAELRALMAGPVTLARSYPEMEVRRMIGPSLWLKYESSITTWPSWPLLIAIVLE